MSNKPSPTHWHRLLGTLLTYLLTPVNITVQTDVPVMTDPPEADIVLLRREGERWNQAQRARLPDGIRDTTAATILIEFKATESFNLDKLLQIVAYGYFYRQSQKLSDKEVGLVLLVSMRPRASSLHKFQFTPTHWDGVYHSDNPLLKGLTLIILAELNNEPHNAYVKCFATQKKAKDQAFQVFEQSAAPQIEPVVSAFLMGLRQIWYKGAYEMNSELTPEKVMELGEKWIDMILASLPPEKVLKYVEPEDRLRGLEPEDRLRGLEPEERLRGLEPEERLRGLEPEDRLRGLTPEEIEAYLQKLKTQKKLGNGGRQIES